MACWKSLIERAMSHHGETFGNVVACTLNTEELLEAFDDDYGLIKGKPFTLWTQKRVYFPVKYDGSESVDSVARNPDGIATKHIGGDDF